MTSEVVFLTGSTGFIGRRLLATLLGSPSHRIRCLSRSPKAAAHPAGCDVVSGEICNPSTYTRALQGVDLVIHLAATTGNARPQEYFRVNVDGTRALLAASRSAGIRRFVFISS